MTKVEKWASEYEDYAKNPPKEGTILRCYGGEDARLILDLVEGKAPFVYARVFVPHIVGTQLGWFLQSWDSNSDYGFKCILLPKSREECLRKLGMTKKKLRIKAIKIIRYSQSGSSILCEVAEYCPVLESEREKVDFEINKIQDEPLTKFSDMAAEGGTEYNDSEPPLEERCPKEDCNDDPDSEIQIILDNPTG